ncbi:MAG: transcription-repair coupling factor [Phycisphaerales bacterium]
MRARSGGCLMAAQGSPWQPLLDDPAVVAIATASAEGAKIVCEGAVGSSTVVLASLIARRTGRPVMLVLAHLEDAEFAVDELELLGTEAIRLPAMEVLPGESSAAADLVAERIAAVRRVLACQAGSAPVIVAPVHALMQSVPRPAQLDRLTLAVETGQTLRPERVVQWLAESGYDRRDTIEEPGEFSVRGGIVDVFPTGGDTPTPIRIDFFGDEVEHVNEIDLETMGSDRRLDRCVLVAAKLDPNLADEGVSFLELVPDRAIAVLAETLEVTEQARGYFERLTDSRGVFGPPAVIKLLRERFHAFAEVNQFSVPHASDRRISLPLRSLPPFSQDAKEAVGELATHCNDGRRLLITCENAGEASRCLELLGEWAPGVLADGQLLIGYLHRGFCWEPEGGTATTVLPYHELLHRFHVRRRARRLRAGRALDTFLEIEPGDYVVHAEHGIAQFVGLRLMSPDRLGRKLQPKPPDARGRSDGDDEEEFLTLEFAGKSQLHVSTLKIDQVQKYIGGFAGKPPLSKLGGRKWTRQKEQVAESVRDLAAELLRVRAARESLPGIRYPDDTPWQQEFEAEFPYQETDDQLAALQAIKRDMTSERPMDRLICGDVGFGKTELAIRAAFKACEFGKQVAVLVPTTVLAEQHARTFLSRFAGYPFRVESLSRFRSAKEINGILAALRKGQVDVIVGTHRLLSRDVRFADLGLVIIDEEQRFGVEHKERLLQLRLTADVLTLSATPIPRTLHMSMLGIRDISSLATAPADRQSIVTEVIPFNRKRLTQAVARELSREGQVFWVHNRVHDIQSAADEVRRLAPDARVVHAHGQMPPAELEQIMLRFIRGDADILVSTTIIESGIDIPRANTMIIDNADRFGLSELHQLRGRVGRSKHRAYCYLLLPENRTINEVARKRLRALEQYSMLGAGFKIAMRDLEIRGAGNILGSEQSGHIAAIGYELYCRLLEAAVRDLTHEAPPPSASRASLELGIGGVIPRPYIPSEVRRLEAYRRIATAGSLDELAGLAQDLESAYGTPPAPVRRLLALAEVRVAASALGVRAIVLREPDVIFRAEDPTPIARAMQSATGTVRVLPPKSNESVSEVYYRPPSNHREPETLLRVLDARLRQALGAGASQPARTGP